MPLESMRRIAARNEPPETSIRAWIDGLAQAEAEIDAFDEALRYEYLFGRSALEQVFQQGLAELEEPNGRPRHWGLQRHIFALLGSTPERTWAHLEALYSHIIHEGSQPWAPSADEESKVFDFIMQRGLRMVLDDPLGRICAAMMVPAFHNARAKHLETIAELRATRIVLAIDLYEREHKKPPEKLADLVPAFLPDVPMDPFANDTEPLQYEPSEASFQIRSKGKDWKNDLVFQIVGRAVPASR
jgi:hypothetical protein